MARGLPQGTSHRRDRAKRCTTSLDARIGAGSPSDRQRFRNPGTTANLDASASASTDTSTDASEHLQRSQPCYRREQRLDRR